MRILQFLPTFAYGDAIGNEVCAIDAALKAAGRETQIYAENAQKKVAHLCRDAAAFRQELKPEDTVLYHMATGSDNVQWLSMQSCRKIMRYHNITPACFFLPYHEPSARAIMQGRTQLQALAGKFDAALGASDYNCQELVRLGYRNTRTVPLILQLEDYKQAPSRKILDKYKDGKTNLLFVGRVAPNKRQEDVIAAFYAYKQLNPNSRLFLIGSQTNMESYRHYLDQAAQKLGLERDVIFPGHITFEELLGYYHVADAFLSMSEHEGFCVPLVESMVFDVPVFAYDAAAIAETMGGSGVVFTDKDPVRVAETIHSVLGSKDLMEKILQSQRERLADFQRSRIMPVMLDALEENI